MLSKAKLKYIRSLDLKKNRKHEHAFVAEGPKLVEDLSVFYSCKLLLATEEWSGAHPNFPATEKCIVTAEELKKASFLVTPQDVLAVFSYEDEESDESIPKKELCLALDDVQDPGNLGTIIRLADWFGIRHIFCSQGTVDAYNPKVVQATMGALARVRLHYLSMTAFVKRLSTENVPIYGTFLDGVDMYNQEMTTHGLVIMGNEGKGITSEVASLVNKRLFIPNYPIGKETSESLNVATATAVILAEFRRRMR